MQILTLALSFFFALFTIADQSYAQSAAGESPIGEGVGEVHNALAAEDWDRALEIIDQKIEQSPESLEVRLLRAHAYSARAQESFYEAPNASILDPNDLRHIGQAAARSARGAEWGLDYRVQHDISRAILDFEFILAAAL